MRIAVAAGALMLMACTTMPPEEAPVPDHGAGTCNAAPVQDLVGRQRSEAVGAEAMRRSGATTLRWIGPGTAYTQDLRRDRINLDTDAGGRITRVRCF
ncbi:MAG TPA: I78 family peptidase inhibitor [Allosphingosinicella sp.]|jgi:hypothetical protein